MVRHCERSEAIRHAVSSWAAAGGEGSLGEVPRVRSGWPLPRSLRRLRLLAM